jgi:hypothetical protein
MRQKGTLQLLEDTLSSNYRTTDGEDISREVVAPLRKIRKLRQTPAHAVELDEYDSTYSQRQDDLVGEAVQTLQKLRWIFSCHRIARQRYAPPKWLDSDKIVFLLIANSSLPAGFIYVNTIRSTSSSVTSSFLLS